MKNDFRIINKFMAVVSIVILTTFNSFAEGPRKAAETSFESGPVTYTVISSADMTVRATALTEDFNEDVLDIPETVWHFQDYTVTEISSSIFSSLGCFKVLNVPASVESIEFSLNDKKEYLMEEINVAEGNPYFTSVDGMLYNKDITVLIKCPYGRTQEVAIPGTVTTIGSSAFSGYKKLVSLTIPDNVTSIETRAFSGSNIESLYIPDSVTQLGDFICSYCESLTEVRLPENGQIKELNCPVAYCSSLKSFRIPEGVERLVNWFNFSGCESLETLYIPASFIDFGSVPFGACYSLVNFIVDENNPVFTSEGPMLLSKDKTELLAFPSASGEIEIHEGIEVIGNAAFSYCTITQLTLPASITDIEGFAFNSCHDLKNIIMLSPVPPSLSSTAFTGEGTGSVGTYYPPHNIFVPKEYLQAYKNTGWESKYSFLHIYSLDWLASVENVDAVKSDSYTVYSLDGRLVLKDSPRADVDKLPGGLYIINGKKVFLHR